MTLMTRQGPQIGSLLRRARDARGWTHEDVASRIDGSLGSYSRWERGVVTPQGHNLAQLIEVLGLDPAEAVAAAGQTVAPGVQAARAEASVAELQREIATLRQQVSDLESRAAASIDPDELAHLVTEIVRRELNPGDAAMDAVLEEQPSRS